MKTETRIHQLLQQADTLAYAEVKTRATAIMETHKNLTGFCMAMGGVFFTDTTGPIEERHYTKSLFKFIDMFDHVLKLTGQPLRLKRVGDIIEFTTDW